MRIDPKTVVAGLPALTAHAVVRGVVRWREVSAAGFHELFERAGVPAGREHATLVALCRDGYLEPRGLEPNDRIGAPGRP